MPINITVDAESSGLLNESSIDYHASPYRLKKGYDLHCIGVERHDTGEIICFYNGPTIALDGRPYQTTDKLGYTYELNNYAPEEYTHKQLDEFPVYIKELNKQGGGQVIGHNLIGFDLLLFKLWWQEMNYSVRHNTWGGVPWEVVDTLCVSKAQNADLFGGHGLDNLSKLAGGAEKVAFRRHVPKEDRFKTFAPDMLYYLIYDCKSNTQVYKWLKDREDGLDWSKPYRTEHRVRDIVSHSEHRGFKFNKDLAEDNIRRLDELIREREELITPLIPEKPATKKFMGQYTPPKIQTRAKGKEVSSALQKWVAKHGGQIEQVVPELTGDATHDYMVKLFGEYHSIPMEIKPLKTTEAAKITDSFHVKNWLMSLGWRPIEYKEKDLTYRTVKGLGKVKRTREEYAKAVDTYVNQTLSCNMQKDRLDKLGVSAGKLREHLLKKNIDRPVKVFTNPSFTVGQEKRLCDNLEIIAEKFPHVGAIVEYNTYRHRRNSILGGNLDWEEEEEAEKGYLSFVRSDGRIPTPADTCGTPTSRFKHKGVANIPRTTSLFGKEMRGLFSAGEGYYQLGYDFDSLEAVQEAHYCYPYDVEGKPYCTALTQPKPNDVHTMTAKKISVIIGEAFGRSPAKSVKYACTYGATEPRVAKTIGASLNVGAMVYQGFWEAAAPLKSLKDRVEIYWETPEKGGKKHLKGIDGRRLNTRHKHALLNTLFQSGGVICAKTTLIIHHDLIEDHGLGVDFFRDDWQNKSFCALMIAYHDEAQLEISKDLVKFKMFPADMGDKDSVKEAKAKATDFKKAQLESKGRVWSDVSTSDKGVFVSWCLPGQLINEAVSTTNERYGMRVPLSAGYIIGRDWAECH